MPNDVYEPVDCIQQGAVPDPKSMRRRWRAALHEISMCKVMQPFAIVPVMPIDASLWVTHSCQGPRTDSSHLSPKKERINMIRIRPDIQDASNV